MTLHASKGLEFLVVAVMGARQAVAGEEVLDKGDDALEEMRFYLAKKAQQLIPGDPAGEAQVVRWCLAAMNSVELPLMSMLFIDWTADGDVRMTKSRQFMVDWAKAHFTGLERWLDGREFVATDSFTVADILMAHVLTEVRDAQLLDPFVNVRGYRDRCLSRPAWTLTMEKYLARVEAG